MAGFGGSQQTWSGMGGDWSSIFKKQEEEFAAAQAAYEVDQRKKSEAEAAAKAQADAAAEAKARADAAAIEQAKASNTYAADYSKPVAGGIASSNPYGFDWQNQPGQKMLYDTSVQPLQSYATLMSGMFNSAGQRLADDPTGTNYMNTMSPQLLQMMGLDEAGQSNMLTQYNTLMQPQRQQQTQAMTNQAAAMGLGGGRLARNLSQMNSGFAQDSGAFAQSLNAQNLTARQAIAQMLNQNAQTSQQQNLGTQQFAAGQLGTTAKAISDVGPTVKLAYDPVISN